MAGQFGFTLRETRIITSVVFILAAILFAGHYPGYHANKLRAICQDNERQLAAALLLYLQDNGSKFPPVGPNHTHNGLGNAGGWADSIEPYVKYDSLFQCPSETHNFEPTHPDRIDYGYNVSLATLSTSSMNNSSNTVLEFEGNQQAATAQTASSTVTAQVYAARHLSGSNYGFVDGHVKWLQSSRAPIECWPPGSIGGTAFLFCT